MPDTGNVRDVLRLEGEARQRHHLVHDHRELGIELAEERRGHGAQHARVGHGRPGTEQDARSGEEIAETIGQGAASRSRHVE